MERGSADGAAGGALLDHLSARLWPDVRSLLADDCLLPALRAEISDVIRRGNETAGSNEQGACPYSGRKTPVSFDDNAPTLYL